MDIRLTQQYLAFPDTRFGIRVNNERFHVGGNKVIIDSNYLIIDDEKE
jgi:hypothetical protein